VSIDIEPTEYEEIRAMFRSTALRLSLLREALVDHGFTDEQAVAFCGQWLDYALRGDNEEEAEP
jgi:hypothetical protein